MSADPKALRGQLAASTQLPYGRPRTTVVESLVAQADALGDPVLARDARQALLSCYEHGGEPLKKFGVFAWVLSRYDADPAAFDRRARYLLLWQFKWLTVGACAHPGVPLAQIEQGLTDMRDRYRRAGEGLAPYLGCRYQVDAHVEGEHAAAESYLAWVRAPRTGFSDCKACEPTNRCDHLSAVGRYEDAVREAMPVLAEGGCLEQPQSAIATVLEALLRTGDAERAASEHLRAVRLMRAMPSQIWWARHILVLARSGRLMRGLDLLEDHLAEVDSPPTPLQGMQLAAAGARLLRGLTDAGRGDLPVTVPAAWGAGERVGSVLQVPVADVAERLTRTARTLAAQFDARNGTGAVGAQMESWLDADALPDLPLDHVTTRRAAGPAPTRAAAGASSGVAAPAPGPQAPPTLAELARRFEESRRRQDARLREDVLHDWRLARTEPAGEAAAGSAQEALDVARLDAAAELDALRDGTGGGRDPGGDGGGGGGGLERLRELCSELAELGDHWSATSYGFALLHHEITAGGDGAPSPEVLLTRVDELVREASAHCTPAELGSLAVGRLGVLYAAGGHGVLELPDVHERLRLAIRTGVDLLESVPPQDLTVLQRGSLALLRGQQAADLEPAARLERLREAWALVEPGERAQERAVVGLDLAGALADAGEFAGAVDVLAEVAGDAQVCDLPVLGGRALAMSARIRRQLREPAAAVEDFVRAGQLFQVEQLRHGDVGPEEIAALRRDLAFALQECGRSLESAEVAEVAVGVLEEELARAGVEPAPPLPPAADVDLADVLAAPAGPADAEAAEAADQGDHGALAAARLAGALRYAAADACAALDETGRAAEHARASAAWHRRGGWVGAQAEALALAGRAEPDPVEGLPLLLRAAALYDATGHWQQACRCRRLATGTALSAHGLPVARQVIGAARTALEARVPEDGEQVPHRWEGLALTEQTARVLAEGDEVADALALVEGLDGAYRELGDLGSVWDVVLLRAQCLQQQDRAEESLPALEAAAQEALEAGAAHRARQLGGQLAELLDDLGRPDDAQEAWQRFSGD